jgi:hypothetical protein
MSKIAQLIATLFEARNRTHILHLQTTSYAQHKALNEYYDGIIDLADSLAECYQGRYGIITDYPSITLPTEAIELLTYVRSWIDSNRLEISDKSEIQNIIDEIQDLHNSVIYKLKFLK